MNKFVGLLAILILSAAPAFAWPACSGNWIQVPAGTSTANGAVVTENGQTFQCQKPSTPTTDATSNSASSTSTSTANSNSSSNATGGSSKSTSTTGPISIKTGGATASTGPVSATGGAANVTNSGNSSATGGAGGQGGNASSVAGNSSSGSGNQTSINETTNVAADRFPVNTAYAAAPYPTAQCYKGYGAGGQSTAFGFSINGGKIDENCAILETARSFDGAGERLAACKVKISNKYAKKAGVTLEDCMKASESVLLQQPIPAPVVPLQQPTPIIVNLPSPVINVIPAPVTIQQMPPAQTPAPLFTTPKPHKRIVPPKGSGIKPCPTSYSKTDICLEND